MLQTFSVPAGGRQVNAKASFFRYESASAAGADESLKVRADGNDLGVYLPGDSITLPIDAKTWELTPVTATATAVVRLGVGGVDSSRIFGNVRVIDQAFDKTLTGNQFFGGTTNPADPGNQCVVSMRLGAGAQAAGKRIAVKKLILVSDVAGDFTVNAGTNVGTAITGGSSGYNKLLGGAASGAVITGGVAGAGALLAAGELPGAQIIGGRISLLANTPFVIELREPLVLTGTAVLAVLGTVVNRKVGAIFEWEEV